MANALYDKGRQKFLEGGIAWLTDDIRVILHDDNDDTPDLANDEFLSDVAVAARVATSTPLAGKTSTSGVADADDITLTLVSGDQFESLIIYQHTGNPATSALIARIDTAVGLPTTPNGGNITIAWDNGANRIFKL